MIFEQDPVQILDALLPLYLNNSCWGSARISCQRTRCPDDGNEQRQRNASELIGSLSLSYNKARQLLRKSLEVL